MKSISVVKRYSNFIKEEKRKISMSCTCEDYIAMRRDGCVFTLHKGNSEASRSF